MENLNNTLTPAAYSQFCYDQSVPMWQEARDIAEEMFSFASIAHNGINLDKAKRQRQYILLAILELIENGRVKHAELRELFMAALFTLPTIDLSMDARANYADRNKAYGLSEALNCLIIREGAALDC